LSLVIIVPSGCNPVSTFVPGNTLRAKYENRVQLFTISLGLVCSPYVMSFSTQATPPHLSYTLNISGVGVGSGVVHSKQSASILLTEVNICVEDPSTSSSYVKQ